MNFVNDGAKEKKNECNAFNCWKVCIFNIIEKRISIYSNNLGLLPLKPKISFRHLKQGIQQFHKQFVLAPADKAGNNAIVVSCLTASLYQYLKNQNLLLLKLTN